MRSQVTEETSNLVNKWAVKSAGLQRVKLPGIGREALGYQRNQLHKDGLKQVLFHLEA